MRKVMISERHNRFPSSEATQLLQTWPLTNKIPTNSGKAPSSWVQFAHNIKAPNTMQTSASNENTKAETLGTGANKTRPENWQMKHHQ
jgi:hypothetical protein